MKKAFLFDMDGVLVNSEQIWDMHSGNFAEKLYGRKILSMMKDMTGTSLDYEYQFAKKHGFAMDVDEYYKRYDEQAAKIYALSGITEGLFELIKYLKGN